MIDQSIECFMGLLFHASNLRMSSPEDPCHKPNRPAVRALPDLAGLPGSSSSGDADQTPGVPMQLCVVMVSHWKDLWSSKFWLQVAVFDTTAPWPTSISISRQCTLGLQSQNIESIPTMSPEPIRQTQLALNDEDRPRYSSAQLRDYFTRIELPQKWLQSPVMSDPAIVGTKEHGLPLLQALTRHHTCSVPFENLELHYSTHKTVSLDPADLYTKFVHRRRGGRCMENNTFFATVLRSLGFDVRNCGGRVSRAMSPFPEVRRNQSATYDGWNHMLNLVRLDGEFFVVDVGMGAMGPNIPYPLRDGFETTSIAPRRIRIQSRSIAESYSKERTSTPKMWCYDFCYEPAGTADDKWLPVYCFTETEFLPQDYEVMSWFTSTHPNSFFTRNVTCTKMLMDESKEKIVGNNTLFEGTIRETIGTNRKLLKECTSEAERVQALAEIFDVPLTEEEKNGISGTRLG